MPRSQSDAEDSIKDNPCIKDNPRIEDNDSTGDNLPTQRGPGASELNPKERATDTLQSRLETVASIFAVAAVRVAHASNPGTAVHASNPGSKEDD